MAKTYDPKLISIIVGGHIVQGFDDGEFVSIERINDMWSTKVGADGEGARAKSNDKSGRITLTTLQTSSSNDVLSGFALADELSNGGQVPVLVKDANGTTIAQAETAYIKKMPTMGFSKEVGNRQWVIESPSMDILVGSNL